LHFHNIDYQFTLVQGGDSLHLAYNMWISQENRVITRFPCLKCFNCSILFITHF